MTDFTFGQILANLLLAARWTIVLSIVSFVSGGLVGQAARDARVEFDGAARRRKALYRSVPGHAVADATVHRVLRPAARRPTCRRGSRPRRATFFTSAYLAEIWRGCVEAVPKGQWEASASLAMSYVEQLRHVILPQAARIAIAPTVGFGVQAVKDTALVSIIGFTELTKVGIAISNATFRPFVVYGLVALIYFALCYPLTRYARTLQRRWHAAR